jgi:bifunctional non-homologous end joining protein LigD
MVEDHPYDYRNFEGIIPSGYGAGTVMIWDEGFYQPANTDTVEKEKQDKNLQRELKNGRLTFDLHGKKLKGEYALIKSNGGAKNSWLLFKVKDKYANDGDITKKDKSVISKKTLAQIEKSVAAVHHGDPVKKKKTPVKEKKTPVKKNRRLVLSQITFPVKKQKYRLR